MVPMLIAVDYAAYDTMTQSLKKCFLCEQGVSAGDEL